MGEEGRQDEMRKRAAREALLMTVYEEDGTEWCVDGKQGEEDKPQRYALTRGPVQHGLYS